MIVEFDFRTMILGIAEPQTVVSVRPRLTVKRIKEVVAGYYHVNVSEMTSRRRARHIARPRQVAMYMARELTPKSLPDIGRIFDRDHTTVMHAVRNIDGLAETDADMAEDIAILRGRLTGNTYMAMA